MPIIIVIIIVKYIIIIAIIIVIARDIDHSPIAPPLAIDDARRRASFLDCSLGGSAHDLCDAVSVVSKGCDVSLERSSAVHSV